MKTPWGILTATFVALCMLFAFAPAADAGEPGTPIDQFVDCTDSFWQITCGLGGFEPIQPRTVIRVEASFGDCRFVGASGSGFDYLPPRFECELCYTTTVHRGVIVSVDTVCSFD